MILFHEVNTLLALIILVVRMPLIFTLSCVSMARQLIPIQTPGLAARRFQWVIVIRMGLCMDHTHSTTPRFMTSGWP
jgi:hypothetical protein